MGTTHPARNFAMEKTTWEIRNRSQTSTEQVGAHPPGSTPAKAGSVQLLKNSPMRYLQPPYYLSENVREGHSNPISVTAKVYASAFCALLAFALPSWGQISGSGPGWEVTQNGNVLPLDIIQGSFICSQCLASSATLRIGDVLTVTGAASGNVHFAYSSSQARSPNGLFSSMDVQRTTDHETLASWVVGDTDFDDDVDAADTDLTDYYVQARSTVDSAGAVSFSMAIQEAPDDSSPVFSTPNIPNQRYTINTAITPLPLPSATYSGGEVTYSLTPALPPGLEPEGDVTGLTNPPTISGTPSAESATPIPYTYTAADASDSSNTATITFTIAVIMATGEIIDTNAPNFLAAAIPDQTYTTDTAIDDLTLPTAIDSGVVTYSLQPPLPAGLTPAGTVTGLPSPPTIRGTPSATSPSTTYTYTATDDSSNSDALRFTIIVNLPDTTPPDFQGETISDQTFTVNMAITDLSLPTATHSTAVAYSIVPALPAGLNFLPDPPTIRGTPSAESAPAVTYTYTATSATNSTQTLTFSIVVNVDPTPPDFGGDTILDQTYTANTAITALPLPRATHSSGSVTYSITPDLPAGLTFLEDPPTIRGTPSTEFGPQTYTYTATTGSGSINTLAFSINVVTLPDFGGNTILDQAYTVNTAITDLRLPTATHSSGSVTYSIVPALPAGLTFLADPPTIRGIPSMESTAAVTYTYTASAGSGSTQTLTFSIVVNAADATPPDFGGDTILDQAYTVNKVITDLSLPTATHSSGSVTYSINLALPAGLTFLADPPTIRGTPSAEFGPQAYTYTATAGSGSIITLTFSIVVNVDATPPDFAGATIDDQTYTANTAITALPLPRATHSSGSVTYSIYPALSAGLTFLPDPPTIRGTPSAEFGPQTYTYTATAGSRSTQTLTFSINVVALPDFEGATIADQAYIVNTVITDLNLPRAMHSSGSVTYSINPALPPRLTFLPDPPTIRGIPSAEFGPQTYTYTATAGSGPTQTLTFSIVVNVDATPPDFGDATIQDQTYTANTAITDLPLPRATHSSGSVTYSITPTLPAGLTFLEEPPTIRGTPSMESTEAVTYTYTATSGSRSTNTLTFSINVVTLPDFADATIMDQAYTANTAITDLSLPRATHSSGSVTYSINPALPAGLTFREEPPTIRGIPSAEFGPQAYTYTATAGSGPTQALTFSIVVNAAGTTPPDFGGDTILDQAYTVNTAITDLNLPRATHSSGSVTYSINPDLPPGLTFLADPPTISGIPSTEFGPQTYTYTATAGSGPIITLTFSIVVNADTTPPDFGSATILDQTYTVNTAITALPLPVATHSSGSVTYSINPDLSPGLTFLADPPTISGTPSTEFGPRAYTLYCHRWFRFHQYTYLQH